jgi:L-alanine-DL-glutamate epimerase-like enolase superfamily enzyme
VRLDARRRTLALARPLHTAYGAIAERDIVLVEIGDGELVGHGEAAPLPAYDGVSVERVEHALALYTAALAQAGELSGARALEICREADPLPSALAAVDIALWDLAARAREEPIAALLCESPAPGVAVNATLSADGTDAAASEAAAAARAGFTCVKVKVGTGDDAGRVAAVRAAVGPDVALRLDANGAWSVPQAVRALDSLARWEIELAEEPVHGLAAIRALRERVAVSLAIDETAGEDGALASGAAHAVCLKLSRCGGISGLLAAAALVRASGAQPYLASTLDGPVGIAAALHAAAALSSAGPLPHCGLATLRLFADLEDPLPARAGAIALPTGPGLGIPVF